MGRGPTALLQDPMALGASGLCALLSAALITARLQPSDPQLHSSIKILSTVLTAVLCIFAAFALTSIGRALWRRSAALRGLPGPKYGLLGSIDAIRRPDPHRWTLEIAQKYGPLAKVRILMHHAVIVTDPALAVNILHSPLFDKFQFMYAFLDPLLGGSSILTGPTDVHWKQVRKAVAPAFSTQHMRSAQDAIVARSLQLVEYLKNRGPQEPQNVDKLLLREAMDVIGDFGFGKKMHALDSLTQPTRTAGSEAGLSDVDVLLGATKEIEARLGGPHRVFQIWKKELWHGAYLLRRYQKQVKGLLSHIKASSPRRDSFADLLLKARHHATGKPLSDADMTPEVAALFFAGVDTTGHTGTWLLYLMTQHPEVEAKVERELDELELLVTPERPNPRPVSYADLGRLTYLQAVVKEVLRMYPPVGIGQIREATADVVIAGKLHIPKGTLLWVPHLAMQNVAHNWADPGKFDPERWMSPGADFAKLEDLPLDREWYKDLNLGTSKEDNAETTNKDKGDSRRPKRYFPFAEGPRNCVGQSLAKVSLVETAATLLSHLTFRLADQMGGPEGVKKREVYALVTGIYGGMWMHAKPRSKTQGNGNKEEKPSKENLILTDDSWINLGSK